MTARGGGLVQEDIADQSRCHDEGVSPRGMSFADLIEVTPK